jgi:hypothetical protein
MTRSLAALPATYADTRLALHRLAFYVVSPARRLATGNEIALAATPGGFGTPPGEPWGQVRVDRVDLVIDRGGPTRREAITTVQEAAFLAGIDIDPADADGFDVPPPGPLDRSLAIDPAAAAVLAAWYRLADDALRSFAAELGTDGESSPPRLWPEHFDLAIDAFGGSWGFSPGDAGHAEPYAYVSLPAAALPARDAFWNAAHFPGVLLPYAALREEDDPCERALTFFRSARRRL